MSIISHALLFYFLFESLTQQHHQSQLSTGTVSAVRTLATDAAAAAPAPVVVKKTGASLWQRLSSFLVGAGLTALGTQFYILDEIRQGNRLMIRNQHELEERLRQLEK
jgi:hypothetical protein